VPPVSPFSSYRSLFLLDDSRVFFTVQPWASGHCPCSLHCWDFTSSSASSMFPGITIPPAGMSLLLPNRDVSYYLRVFLVNVQGLFSFRPLQTVPATSFWTFIFSTWWLFSHFFCPNHFPGKFFVLSFFPPILESFAFAFCSRIYADNAPPEPPLFTSTPKISVYQKSSLFFPNEPSLMNLPHLPNLEIVLSPFFTTPLLSPKKAPPFFLLP